jgi:hypothetical protein
MNGLRLSCFINIFTVSMLLFAIFSILKTCQSQLKMIQDLQSRVNRLEYDSTYGNDRKARKPPFRGYAALDQALDIVIDARDDRRG